MAEITEMRWETCFGSCFVIRFERRDTIRNGEGRKTVRTCRTGNSLRSDESTLNWSRSKLAGDGLDLHSAFPHALLWDLANEQQIGAPVKHADSINAVAFHPRSDVIVTAGADSTVNLADGRTGALLSSHTGEQFAHVHTVSFNPAGDRLFLSFHRSGRLVPPSLDHSYLWKFQDGKLAESPMLSFPGEATRPPFNFQGNRIATIAEQVVHVWDAETGRRIGDELRHDDYVHCAAFSPLGDLIVTGCVNNGRVQVWDVSTGVSLGEQFKGTGRGQIESVAFSASGDRVLAAHGQHVLQWQVPIPPQAADFETYCELITSHRVNEDGEATELPHEEWIELWKSADRIRPWTPSVKAPEPLAAATAESAALPDQQTTTSDEDLVRDVAVKICGVNANCNLRVHSAGESRQVDRIEDVPTGEFRIEVINLVGKEIDDDFIKGLQLHRLPPLNVLIIRKSEITGESLRELGRLSRLPDLGLSDNQNIGDDGIQHLAKLGIRTLRVNRIQMTDKGLAALKQFNELTLLELEGNKCTDAGIAELRSALPRCKIFP